MVDKRIAAFSLLAHINDTNVGINSFEDIFIPIIKSALCKLNLSGVKTGQSIMEIKEHIDRTFYLDIPIPVLRTLLIAISKEINNDDSEEGKINYFILNNDGSYEMNKYLFADYEEELEERQTEIEEVNNLYKTYLLSKGLDESKEPSIFTFIDQNRISLSKYFAYHQENSTLEEDFIHQANFINSIKKNKRIYEILRRVYLGSLISAYLEVDIGQVKNKVELLLDTNFILGILDLNSIEATHTCRKILEICNRLGYSVSVLPFTIEEAELLIERKAQQLESAFFQGHLDPESIYNAAKRRNLSKTQLQQIARNLKDILVSVYNIKIIGNDQKLRNLAKYQYSEVYEFYRGLRGDNGFSALHDATAVVYVKEKRGGKPIKGNILKATCWFVTNTPYGLKLPDNKGYLPEVIRAEEILNFLWLSNPSVTQLIESKELSNLGLTRLVSSTISYSLPSVKVLRDLDDNFTSYGGTAITADDTVMVATMIANKKIKNPDELNKLASNNAESFIRTVKDYAEKGRQEEKELNNKLEQILGHLDSIHQQAIEDKKQELNSIEVKVEDQKPDNTHKLKNYLIILSMVFASFVWWSIDRLIGLSFILEQDNYWLIKIFGQMLIVFVSLAITKKENKTAWISTSVAVCIALLISFKKSQL